MKINTKTLSILVIFIQVTLSNFYCENNAAILQDIKKIETSYIGEGSFGKIYGNSQEVSKTMKTDDLVSLQLLNNELKLMAAFKNEFDMMQLHSNNCWFQKNHGLNNYEVKIKMDRMQGDVKKAITSNPLRQSLFWKLDMLFKLATSLKKLHDINVLHLDLKEQNIMMMNDYTPVLADFGMAKLPGEIRNFVGGTPLFMAPEVERGVYSDKADIYALGVIFFQLLNEKFVTQKYFRKLCDYNEYYYSHSYCLFDKLVANMLNSNADLRLDINQVILQILKVFTKVIPLNVEGFNNYLQTEKQSYSASNASFSTKKNSDQLIQKFNQRQTIYAQATADNNSNTLNQMIQSYCTPLKDPKKFLNKYNDKFAFVGPTAQEIEKLDQTFYQEDLQKSKINLQKRMNFAEESRIQILDQRDIFQQNAIQDNHVHLPQIQINKKAVSNNIQGQFQHMQHQKKYGFDQGVQHQQVINKLNLSPQKNYHHVQQYPNGNIVQNAQANVNKLYQPNNNRFNYQAVNNFNNQNLNHHYQQQFLMPQQNLVVNQPQVRQPVDFRVAQNNEYQRNQQRQHTDNVGAALQWGNDYRHQKFQGNLHGRFII